jgi:hypothetical protein
MNDSRQIERKRAAFVQQAPPGAPCAQRLGAQKWVTKRVKNRNG